MNLDDSDKDYFLHDFKNDPEADAEATQSGPQQTSPSFDFSSGDTQPQGAPTRRRKSRKGWVIFFLILFLALSATVGIRYFVPYITESQVTGYVTLVEKRGIIFKTFEGEMVSEAQLADTGRVYSRDIYFSIPDDSIARKLQQYQGTGQPVTITCKKYYGTLPWRGASNTILVSFSPRQ